MFDDRITPEAARLAAELRALRAERRRAQLVSTVAICIAGMLVVVAATLAGMWL
ncbi:hypothetical protein [Prauserella shujinwangii]|uniref:hypothetical protein n=1 Tax=Prauserella shujinwangii TaxID=1453103 RepID=UPI0015E60961|nr:hypothetical protein [Prauserella shujinwangii]